VPLDQRHHAGQPLQDLPLARGLDGLDEAVALPVAPDRPGDRVRGGPEPAQDRRRVEVGGQQEVGHLLLHVPAQPAHRGELGSMGLLVQAHPAAEVMRVDVKLALDHEDVRRDQGQAPGGRGVLRHLRVGRQEQLVLAEHPSREVGEDEPGLHAGDPGPQRGHHGPGRWDPPLLTHVVHQRVENHAEAVDVGADPARPVHDSHPPDFLGAGHPGDLPHRLGDRRSKLV
jgi:hypothetical protein